MLHTLELIQSLGEEELYDITSRLHFSQWEQEILFGNGNFSSIHRSLNSHNPEVGIKDFYVLRRDDDQTGYPLYFAVVEIEPLVMLTGELTLDLFCATQDNVRRFQERFCNVMSCYLTHENLITLEPWQCRRIDYTFNFRFNTSTEKELFLELTRKTSRHVRKQPKRISHLKLNDQSTAEGNHSVKVMFYDKQKQIEETYTDIPVDQKLALLEAADNIIRFEVQCLKGRVLSLKRKH